jgi:hypothetical protein
VQRILLGNLFLKILMVLLVAVPIVVVGGYLYHLASGQPVFEGFFKIYALLYRAPGAAGRADAGIRILCMAAK